MVVGPGDQVGARAARLLLLGSREHIARFDAVAVRFRLIRRLNPLQPSLLPVVEAAGLTPAMGLAVAAHALEVDGVPHPVSYGFRAGLSTRNRRPQNCSISGMNGRFSSSPFSSSVARISDSLRTSTSSPTRRLRRWSSDDGLISMG